MAKGKNEKSQSKNKGQASQMQNLNENSNMNNQKGQTSRKDAGNKDPYQGA